MTTIVRRPTTSLRPRLLPQLERVFSDFFIEPFSWVPTVGLTPRVGTVGPEVDVYETDTEVVVKAGLPGVRKEDVELIAEDGHLILRGEVKRDEEVKDEGYVCRERLHGRFERVLALPTDVDEQHITATYGDGVLEVRVPKKPPEPRGTKVEIQ